MSNLFSRLFSRIFPRAASEKLRVEAARPESLSYRLKPILSGPGLDGPTPLVDAKGRFVVAGVVHKLDKATLARRQRIASITRTAPTANEWIFSGLEREQELREVLREAPEIELSSAAKEVFNRKLLALETSVDFDAYTGNTSVTLTAAGVPVQLATAAQGPVMSHAGRFYAVSPAQQELLGKLARYSPHSSDEGVFRFDASATPELVPYLRARSDVAVRESATQVRVSPEPLQPTVMLEEQIPEQSLLVNPTWTDRKTEEEVRPESLTDAGNWVRAGPAFYPELPQLDPYFAQLLKMPPPATVKAEAVPDFLESVSPERTSDVAVNWKGEALEVVGDPPQIVRELEFTDAGHLRQTARVESASGEVVYEPGEREPSGKWTRRGRRFLRNPNSDQIRQASRETRVYPADDEIAEALLAREHEPPGRRKVRLGPRARTARIDPSPATRVAANLDLGATPDHIRLSVAYEGGASSIGHEELGQLPPSQRWYRSGNNFQKIDREAFRRVSRMAEELGGQPTRDGYSFPSYLYAEILSRFGNLGVLDTTEIFKRWQTKLLSFDAIEKQPLPGMLRPEWLPRTEDGHAAGIRPYQGKGYDWLCFLKKHGLGGILADEMGLGKTVQTLLTIARLKEDNGNWCSLIITPKTAISHWESDARQFFGGLRVRRWMGLERAVAAGRPETVERNFDVILTNYERVRADIHFFEKLRFRFVILDEAHKARNPDSQTHKAVSRLRAECRIALTGTPVQTSLRDLWGVYNLLMPHLLGSASAFRQRYEVQRDFTDLGRRLNPFLLHRRKDMPEIARDLPPKLYRSRECEMVPDQRNMYELIRKGAIGEVMRAAASQNFAAPNILQIMTRLIQCCLHPFLIDHGDSISGRSGKAAAVVELLEELLADPENRVVVFSRFLDAVALIQSWMEPVLKRLGASSAIMVGRTPDAERTELISEFNRPGSAQRLFVVSLMTGGSGINLPAANHVVLFDRWWNPAVELQAEDRAYRLNSKRPVTVHRITTADSIEEHMERIIVERLRLVRDVMDPQAAVEKLITRKDLLAIFGIGGQPTLAQPSA